MCAIAGRAPTGKCWPQWLWWPADGNSSRGRTTAMQQRNARLQDQPCVITHIFSTSLQAELAQHMSQCRKHVHACGCAHGAMLQVPGPRAPVASAAVWCPPVSRTRFDSAAAVVCCWRCPVRDFQGLRSTTHFIDTLRVALVANAVARSARLTKTQVWALAPV